MRIRYSVAICGKICTGKSSLVQFLSEQFSFSAVSFGNMVKLKVAELQLQPYRSIYQRIGYELFITMGADQLLKSAICASMITSFDRVVFDGIRHVAVLNEIRSISDSIVAVYLKSDEMLRFYRYNSRQHEEGFISLEDFRTMDRHPIEQGIEELSNLSNVILDTSESFANVCSKLTDLLRTTGLTD